MKISLIFVALLVMYVAALHLIEQPRHSSVTLHRPKLVDGPWPFPDEGPYPIWPWNPFPHPMPPPH